MDSRLWSSEYACDMTDHEDGWQVQSVNDTQQPQISNKATGYLLLCDKERLYTRTVRHHCLARLSLQASRAVCLLKVVFT